MGTMGGIPAITESCGEYPQAIVAAFQAAVPIVASELVFSEVPLRDRFLGAVSQRVKKSRRDTSETKFSGISYVAVAITCGLWIYLCGDSHLVHLCEQSSMEPVVGLLYRTQLTAFLGNKSEKNKHCRLVETFLNAFSAGSC